MTQKANRDHLHLPEADELNKYMQEAIKEAQNGMDEGGVPIGSILVRNGEIIGRGHNRRIQFGDPTAHGEIDCLRAAGRQKSYKDTIMFSTLMPCAMCAGACIQFGIPIVVAGEDKTFESSRNLMENAGIKVIDLNLDECFNLLQKFAKAKPSLWNEDIGVED